MIEQEVSGNDEELNPVNGIDQGEVLAQELAGIAHKSEVASRDQAADQESSFVKSTDIIPEDTRASLEYMEEMTRQGIYHEDNGVSNLEQLIANGFDIKTGASPEELRLLEEAGKIAGRNYITEISSMAFTGTFSEAQRAGEKTARLKSARLIKDSYDRLHQVLKNNLAKPEAERKPATLDNLPELKSRLEALGIASPIQERLFAAWHSYMPRQKGEFNEESINKLILKKIKKYETEILTMERFERDYGRDEMIKVIESFGIVNFSRYPSEMLHKQMQDWESGDVLVKNILITAVDDWNGSLSEQGQLARVEGLGLEGGLFFFEASSKTDIAQRIVSVGNRDRKNGRDPEEINSVKNLIIAAHGNPYGMVIGPDESLDVSDYPAVDSRIKVRQNDYRRHLGNDFAVILDSCSTAGKPAEGENIASIIADAHNVEVHASPYNLNGLSKITPDGRVFFWESKSPLPATVIDGTGGKGVDESIPLKTRWRQLGKLIREKI